jgi:CRISPR-associated exonuclease Cas4
VSIRDGALFYGAPRRRRAVEFTVALRMRTEALSGRMRELYRLGVTPAPIYFKNGQGKKCESCSLRELCLPRVLAAPQSVERYLKRAGGGWS